MSNILLIILFGISAVTAMNEQQYVEAAVGRSVTFPCKTVQDSNTVVWHHFPSGAKLQNTVCVDDSVFGIYRGRFTVTGNNHTGEFNLNILGTRLQDSGKFVCTRGKPIRSFELIVLESYPSSRSCTSNSSGIDIIGRNSCNIEPDVVSLSCTLRYQGNVIADLEWKSTSGSSMNPAVKSIDNEKTVSTLILKTGQQSSGTYSCFVKYVNNTLFSNYSCTSMINISTLFNQTIEYSPDCNIQSVPCSTKTTNGCSYTWTNNKSEDICSESTLALQSLQDGQYTCKADCVIRMKHRCTFVPLKVNVTCGHGQTSASHGGVIAGTVIGVFVAVAVIVGVTIFLLRHNRKKNPIKSDKTNSSDDTHTAAPHVEERHVMIAPNSDNEETSETETPQKAEKIVVVELNKLQLDTSSKQGIREQSVPASERISHVPDA